MSTMHGIVPARKKVATYGKAARRRIPESSFTAAVRKSQAPEASKIPDLEDAAPITVETLRTQLKPVPRLKSQTPLPTSTSPNLYDLSEDEVPEPIRRPIATPPKLKSKSKSSTPPSVPVKKADIFDIPTSDDEAPRRRTTPQVSKTLPRKNAEPKVIKTQKTAPALSKPVKRTTPDVFDVPSSDDEPGAKPRAVSRKTYGKPSALSSKQKGASTTLSTAAMEDVNSRKRLKLSPAPAPAPISTSPRRLPVTTKVIPQRPKQSLSKPNSFPQIGRPSRSRTTSPQKGQPAIRTIKSKLQAPVRSHTQPVTPKKVASPEPSTPSPQAGDIDMMDVDIGHEYISPKGLQMWNALLDPTDADTTIVVSPAKITRDEPRRHNQSSVLSRPAGVVKASQKGLKPLPRKRLIDCLVEQAAEEESDAESSEDEGTQSSVDTGSPSSQAVAPMMSLSLSREQSSAPEAPMPPPVPLDSQGSQGGPKFTYSKQRSMLSESDLMAQLAMPMPPPPSQSSQGRRARMATVPPLLKSLTSLNNMDEDEDMVTPAVKSVHELRKLGANNRFLDEIQDFLDRIGSPGTSLSTRRSGLMDLASKMQDKSFAEQFRANGIESKLFLHLGQETDIVVGFLMVSLLTCVLHDGNMSHIIPQLRKQGITRLLIRLLECQSDIVVVAKERKSNMSRVAQSLLVELVADMKKTPFWEEMKPQVLSPRACALRCLDVMVQQTRYAGLDGEIFSKELTVNLFEIMKTASDQRAWDRTDRRGIDLALAVSALRFHSLVARTALNEAIWISDFLPVIAETLEIGLSRPVEELGQLQLDLFKLVLNVTHDNPKGCDVFARPMLLSLMGQIIVAKLKQISGFMAEDELSGAIDCLVQLQDMMSNFAECSLAIRESMQSLAGEDNDPLEAMVQVFADVQDKLSEAESMEDTVKNIAFAGLSVLLGNLALLPALRQRITNAHPKKTFRPIVAVIEEVLSYYRTIEADEASQDNYNPETSVSGRLEILLRKLAEQ